MPTSDLLLVFGVLFVSLFVSLSIGAFAAFANMRRSGN